MQSHRRNRIEKNGQNLRWIIFDLDDTLIDSTKIYRLVYKQLRLGSDLLAARNKAKKIAGSKNPSQHNRLIYFKNFIMTQKTGSATETLKLMDRYESQLRKEVRRDVKRSGVHKLLSRLKRHFRLAVFTNETLRTQLIKLQELDPSGRKFDLILTSEEIGQEKAQAGSFSKILRQLGAKASECLMVGDSLQQDIRPARQAGLRTIQIKKAGKIEPVLELIPKLGKLRTDKIVSSR